MSDTGPIGGHALAYGSWPSPLSAAALAAGATRLGAPAVRDGEVWWSELRPAEGGRSVLVRAALAGGPDGPGPVDALPADLSARTQAHEYGGGAWWLGRDAVYVANWSDQRLYRLAGDGTAVPLTPEPPRPRAWRYADGVEHPDGGWVVCVRERHVDDGGAALDEAVNELVAIPTDQPGSEARPLEADADRADFVAAPRVSPDGRWMSWIRWNHPDMPWDGTELCVAPVFNGLRLGNVQVVAGGRGEAIQGPNWTSTGDLVFSTDRSGFWNLHAWTPGSDADRALTSLDGSEIGGPQWVFGIQQWVERSDGRLVVVETVDATDRLAVVEDGRCHPLVTDLVDVTGLAATTGGTVVVTGASPAATATVVELDEGGHPVAVHRSPDDVGLDESWISRAEPIRCPAVAGHDVHAFFYPPTGSGLTGEEGERPPLVVMGHGGPTSHTTPALNLRIQYWTSRGFAVVDVNYGGSSGFGRAYRRLLDDAWGVVDVDDCIAVARHLAATGRVDGDRMVIRGGSAGGFTVLSALIRSEAFAAGTSLYGVVDLEALARDTHKFESRYLDGLVGPYPERLDRYHERSPIHHTDGLSSPLLVLQGLEDEVVPPNQAEAIVAAVAAKGIPHAYVAFEGEQHGFRQADNIVRAFEVELWFYGRVLGFAPADQVEAPQGAVDL